MKVLIVCSSFYPVNSPRSFRATELAKELVRQGHEVVVYCADTIHRDASIMQGFEFPIHIYHESKDVFAGKHDLLSRFLFKLSHDLLEYPRVSIMRTLPKAIKDEGGYDLLISIAVPHPIHWAIGKMYQRGKRLAKVWVADCGDPFMLAQSDHNHPFYFKYLEKIWCKYCDYISVPTEKAYLSYYPEFRDKIRVIPQGFNFDEVKLKDYRPNEVATFAYSGSFIQGIRDLRPVLDVIESLKVDFRFYVYTSQKSMLEPYESRLKGKLILSDYIERSELLYRLSGMDFLISLENSGVSSQTPSKLIDYTLTKRPILSIDCLHINATLLNEFFAGNYHGQLVVNNIDRYSINIVVKQFVALASN